MAMRNQKQGVHRHTANSEAGRRMISPGKEHNPLNMTKEQRDWNAQVEARKAAKKAAKNEPH